tara:strand:+ start:1181 stop:1483 length:303 start_codon:yes stop_codon:yes gene_type:complete
MKTIITAWEIEIEVDHDPYPAQNGGRTDPSFEAGTDINGAVIAGTDINIDELIGSIPKGWSDVEELISEAEMGSVDYGSILEERAEALAHKNEEAHEYYG